MLDLQQAALLPFSSAYAVPPCISPSLVSRLESTEDRCGIPVECSVELSHKDAKEGAGGALICFSKFVLHHYQSCIFFFFTNNEHLEYCLRLNRLLGFRTQFLTIVCKSVLGNIALITNSISMSWVCFITCIHCIHICIKLSEIL